MRELLIILLAVAVAAAAAIATHGGGLTAHRAGRLVLLVGLCILPVLITGTGVTVGVHESSQTTFCMSCHEMEPYGKSLFVDGNSLPALHYQRRLIDRDTVCFSCHTDYAMFGDAKAKLNGLRHVWVHYTGQTPKKIKLYQPYPNHNCLHCHDDARGFVEVPMHQEKKAEIANGKQSCLGCHSVVHDMDAVKAGNFWVGE
ncbi:MAG: NapC/NirT family cytochrome c [Polyangiales bacterium]|nr:NapC/NirT family cytochrome c [Myxococcales bacterium]